MLVFFATAILVAILGRCTIDNPSKEAIIYTDAVATAESQATAQPSQHEPKASATGEPKATQATTSEATIDSDAEKFLDDLYNN